MHNTHRIGAVNTLCIDPYGIVADMTGDKEIRAQRLREARINAGFSSAKEAAERFHWGEAGYRHHENGTRALSLDAARKYGRAFKVNPGWLLAMSGIDAQPPSNVFYPYKLVVYGTVAAGIWREMTEEYPVMTIDAPSMVEESQRVGFVVDGYSMDLCYEPGTVLDCLSIFNNGVHPENGDHVIAERVRPDGLRERTVKEVVKRDGKFFLAPRSTKPEFQEEIEIGAPSDEAPHDGEQISVIAFVVGSIPPRSLRLLKRMGKVSPYD